MAGKSRKRKQGRSKQAKRRRSWLGRVARFALTASIWAAVGLTALVAWYAYDLPDMETLREVAGRRGATVTILAADGAVFARYGELYGAAVRLEDLPPHLPHAVLAVEDRRFYEHGAVDPAGVARAMWDNVRAGGLRSGGSTISQQLAKNLFLSSERRLRRKVQELLLAIWLERNFTKDQILTIYLNRVYFGAGVYGVDAAARRYFGKPARQVTVYEAAMLAGLLKAPSRYNPLVDRERADARARIVLTAMVEAGWLDRAGADAALRGKTVLRAAASGRQSRYFADWVMDRARGYIGYRSGDLVIETTFDARLQGLAEKSLARTLERAAGRDVGQGALVAMRPDGAVVAMVGGRDYRASQFNRATQALRQPGSAFKLFVYLAAIESGLRPGDEVEDAPVTVDGWSPRNAARNHRGKVTMREAAARSINSVAVMLAERVGRGRVRDVALKLGITSKLGVDPSLALGAYEVSLLELTAAYAVAANRGNGVWPWAIREIRSGDGTVLYRRSGGGPGRVAKEADIAAINDILTAAITWGTGKAAKLNRPAAGKTGTSQNSRDAWFIGYTPDLVTGVWFGNDDNSPMKGVGGGSFPALAWKGFMAPALKALPPKPLLGVTGR